ncbi:hypothetical protein [Thermocatellispora tengchongensis]|uniref:hypothetical protein n=1 Tax=Thermocatellispora tengchongensis TaxID=1073253 RepID=UPI00362CF88F
MDQRLSDVQQELVRSADQMLERHAPLDRIDAVAATEHGYDRDLLARTAMLGWTGLGLERAGEESTLVELGLVVSRMGYFAVASPLRATMSAGLLAARLPEATQACDDLLARIAGEAAPVCVLDARDLDGDGTIGQVEWAAAADAFLLVTAEDADRIAVRLLPRHHAAVSVTPLRSSTTSGWPTSGSPRSTPPACPSSAGRAEPSGVSRRSSPGCCAPPTCSAAPAGRWT